MLKLLALIYVLACVFALLFIPASARGWFGLASDPLAGIFAGLLSLPWILVLDRLGLELTGIPSAVLCMGINLLILLVIDWLVSRRRP